MLRRESWPFNVNILIGTLTTGRGDIAAAIPGKCAAPPAPAIITWIPLPDADLANEANFNGIRWVDIHFFRVSAIAPDGEPTILTTLKRDEQEHRSER